MSECFSLVADGNLETFQYLGPWRVSPQGLGLKDSAAYLADS